MRDVRQSCFTSRSIGTVLFGIVGAIALALGAAQPAIAAPAQELAFHGPDALARLATVVVGQGIEGIEARPVLTPDGSAIEWRVVQDSTDEAGERHLVYQQVLVPGRELAEQMPARYATQGIRLLGGVVGLHFEGSVPTSVFLSQYREPGLGSVPSILRPEDALMVVQEVAEGWRDSGRGEWLERGSDELRSELEKVEALIRPTPEGELRLFWRVPSVNEEGVGQMVLVDAASHEIEANESTRSWSTCVPGTSAVYAVVIPQNPAIPNRLLMGGAVTAVGRTDGWAYEASWPGRTSQRPGLNVWMATDAGTSAYGCSTYGSAGILPLGAVDGTATYGPASTPILTGGTTVGSTSGDAIWHSWVVASYLKSLFGVCSYDGACSPISLYMRWNYASASYRGYANWQWDGLLAPMGVWVYPAGVNSNNGFNYPREASASLDVMGHEIGHGVIYGVGGGFSNVADPFVKQQLYEGFADVFGHSIEQKQHPAGTGFEKRDWMFGEDHMSTSATNMQYWRRVDANDGHSSYHKDHHPANWNTDFYVQANMIPVALRLLTVGGTNPICPGYSGCTTSVTMQGIDKAAKILGGVVTLHGSELTGWPSVVQLAKYEAYRRYKKCTQTPPYPATAEQQAVRDAFTAIGYPDPDPLIQCP